MPRDFNFAAPNTVGWIPLPRVTAETLNQRVEFVARLRPGMEFAAANSAVKALNAQLDQSHPQANKWGVGLVLLDNLRVNPGPRRMMVLTFGAVTFVLLIACANVANLLLVRRRGSRSLQCARRWRQGGGRAHPTSAHGKSRARGARNRRWTRGRALGGAGDLDRRAARIHRSHRQRSRDRLARHGVCERARECGSGDLRLGAGAAGVAFRRESIPRRNVAQRADPRTAEMAARLCRGADGAGFRVARRGGFAAPGLHAPERRVAGLRDQKSLRAHAQSAGQR